MVDRNAYWETRSVSASRDEVNPISRAPGVPDQSGQFNDLPVRVHSRHGVVPERVEVTAANLQTLPISGRAGQGPLGHAGVGIPARAHALRDLPLPAPHWWLGDKLPQCGDNRFQVPVVIPILAGNPCRLEIIAGKAANNRCVTADTASIEALLLLASPFLQSLFCEIGAVVGFASGSSGSQSLPAAAR
jgi:hypothetical protein